MNKTSIKNFAVWARNKLIADITYKASLMGIAEDGIKCALPQSTKDVEFYDIGTKKPYSITGDAVRQRRRLVELINQKAKSSEYKTSYHSVLEEVAYTWFNRLIAIRFMEVNDYLPSHIRVLSSESGTKQEPDLVTTPFDAALELNEYEQSEVVRLKNQNHVDDLFRMLFVKQCNALNEILPKLFEKTADYTELLQNVSVTDQNGVVYHLVHDIDENDFNIEKGGQVEIIGWLYQYYNTEPKEQVFANLKKNIKITKENIPAATQLFTPDWIVRYMVENSLGRLWVEGHPNESLKSEWKYYLDEAEQEESVKAELAKIRADYKNIKLEEIKLIDPCMGSGHILVYAFDVFMDIYESQGYTERDAAQSIVEHNLYGLDIDERAYQLAYFAIMMKARKYDRRFLTRGISPNLIYTSSNVNYEFANKYNSNELLEYLRETESSSVIGSLIECSPIKYDEVLQLIDSKKDVDFGIEFALGWEEKIKDIKEKIKLQYIVNQKYDVVVTNPPYMGNKGMNAQLSDYVQKNYPNSKSDLFAVFIERCLQMTKSNGYTAMITQHAFMFLSSYEKLRGKLLHTDFINMAHLGARAFEEIGGEVVQTTSFVMRKSHTKDYKGTYARLVDYNSQQEKENAFLAKNDLHTEQQENFSKMPGSPIAYWVSENFIKAFEKGEVLKVQGDTRQGMATSDNNRFLRLWFEIENTKLGLNCSSSEEAISINKKWYPYNKGGQFRKWYGNIEYTLNYENNGLEVKHYAASLYKSPTRTIKSISEYFKHCLSWSKISSGSIAFRYYPQGFVFDVAGCCIFYKSDDMMFYDFGFINSKIAKSILSVISPTLNYEAGHIASLPIIRDENYLNLVIKTIKDNIHLSKRDWDSFETSWDFEKHPLLNGNSILSAFENWKVDCENRFNTLKANEEELNRIFIDIYGLADELTPEVENKDVTVYRIYDTKDDVPESMNGSKYVLTKQDVVKSFVSYAVGCMFGRYSLDVDGLAYAGGDWDDSKYSTFIPDTDNVIPITDEEYLEDDIVGLFVAFVKKVYGEDTLEENLDFIAKALGNKGKTSREIIRNYFLKNFYKDNVHTYKKRPIYWLYDSGKQNGFKALIYMHRYDENTTGNLRIDYLHRMERVYDSEISRMQDTIDNSSAAREVTAATKRKEKLQKQVKECKEYDEKIAHLALSRIAIDLDDGVKVNYEKVQTGTDGVKYPVLAKI